MEFNYTNSNGNYHINANTELQSGKPEFVNNNQTMNLLTNVEIQKKRSYCNKNHPMKIIASLCLILICLLGIFVALYFHAKIKNTSKSEIYTTCITKDCVQVASRKYQNYTETHKGHSTLSFNL